MNGNNDDFVVRHRTNDFHDVLRIFGAQARGRFVKKINIRRPDHVETDVESFSFAAS